MKTLHTTPKSVPTTIHRYLKLITWFIIMLAFAILNEVKGQAFYGSVYTQSTIAGLQQGTELGYTTSRNFGVGVFFQSSEVMSLEGGVDNYPFYGVSFQVPIKASCNGLSLVAQARAGVADHTYLVVSPQIETQWEVNRFLTLGLNMAYRAGHSAVGARLSISI